MGTPDFAVPALKALIHAGHDVICAYTQPPRPRGRGQKVQPSPVHQAAEEHKIPVRTPKSLRKDEAAQMEFAALDADLAVVAAYGLLLPETVLAAPRFGCLNIHASLLPRWRGASPIQSAILHGDSESGISIMQMDKGLDTGPVLAREAVPIRETTTAQSLHDELAALGAAMIVKIAARLAAGEKLKAQPQDSALATHAPMLTKEDGRIDWKKDAAAIGRQVRALTPWPGAWTVNIDDRRFKIIAAEATNEAYTEPPGTLIDRTGHVACGGDTGLRILSLQPENAKAMDVAAAINGGYMSADEVFY